MGGKSNTMTQTCNLMIIPCNQQLVSMVIVNDTSINFDRNKIITASMEYNSIPFKIYQDPQISTDWDDKRLPCHQYATECLLTLTHLCIWSLGIIYLTIMEPVQFEITLNSTIGVVYSRIHKYSKHYTEWVENQTQ
jgi:hypothetical protein